MKSFFWEYSLSGLLEEVCAMAEKKDGAKRVTISKKKQAAFIKVAVLSDKDDLTDKNDLAVPPGPPVKDGQYYIKTELLKELSAITGKMITSAKAGGTAPLRLLWELGKLHEDATMTRKRRPPSLGKLLMAEIRKNELRKSQPPKQTGKQK